MNGKSTLLIKIQQKRCFCAESIKRSHSRSFKWKLLTKIIGFFSIYIVCLGIISCSKEDSTVPVTQLETYQVEAKTIGNSLYFSGIINPLKEESLTSPIEGIIKKQFFRYGQEVKKGQDLFSISPDRLEKEYIESVSNYIKAQDDYTTKKRKFSGSEELRNLQFIADNEYYADKTSMEESYFALQQSIRQMKEIMKKMGVTKDLKDINIKDPEFVKSILHNKFDDYIVRAQTNGIALTPQKGADENTSDNKVTVGGEVKQGQVLLSIGDMSGLSVTIDVNEIDVNQLKPQQKATVTGTAFPGIILEGHIKYVDAQAKSNGSSALPAFPVTINIPNISPDARQIIRAGMSARIEITIDEPNSIVVPLKAVFQEGGRSKIKLKTATGEIKTINIITGRTTQDSIIIKQGLKPGDTIVYDH